MFKETLLKNQPKMIDNLTLIYLLYTFVALYFLSLFTLTFIQNRKEIFLNPLPKKKYTLSILVPAFNEESSIRETIESILKSDYENILEIIIINDGSTDNTLKIAK